MSRPTLLSPDGEKQAKAWFAKADKAVAKALPTLSEVQVTWDGWGFQIIARHVPGVLASVRVEGGGKTFAAALQALREEVAKDVIFYGKPKGGKAAK
jgi:hypothetical protein